MKPLGKQTENVSEDHEVKEETEMKDTSAAISDTDALLKELEDVLEITKKEETAELSKASGEDADAKTEPNAEIEETDKAETKPDRKDPINHVSFASMAQAVEEVKKEPTGRFSRDAFDDEKLLAELHALIGDPVKPKPMPQRTAAPVSTRPAPLTAPAQLTAPAPRPAARITQETLNNIPDDDYDDLLESDNSGVPGWVKGIFILLVSLLVGAMTFYAVATDVIGKIF